MDSFTRNDLTSLLAVEEAPCITITLPADPAQAQAAPILLKNLHREAARQLEARGLKPQEAARLLEPVEKLIADPLYWREQSGGLAIFLAGGFFQTFHVPIALEERVAVRDRFIFSPIIPLMAGDGRFHVLTLSRKQVRLLEGSRAGLAERLVEGLPPGPGEAAEKEGRQRGSSVNAFGSAPEEDDRTPLERFFREVDKVLQPILRPDCDPLVLAGVDSILPVYRAVNTYPRLVEGGVIGSPEPIRPAELHPKAWGLVKPIFEQEQREAVGQYEQLSHTERASNDAHKIVPAAFYGRVERLLLARGVRQPGHFDAGTGKVVVHKTDRPDSEDLLDLAAIQTLMHDGKVYPLPVSSIPDGSPLAAVFRY